MTERVITVGIGQFLLASATSGFSSYIKLLHHTLSSLGTVLFHYICKSSKMEEEYERVKKLRKKSEPSWVLNRGPSDC